MSCQRHLRNLKPFIATSSTFADRLVVRRYAAQVDQALALLARNVVAHVPRPGTRQQRAVRDLLDAVRPCLFAGLRSVDAFVAYPPHFFEQRDDPLALQLGAGWSVAECRWGLRAVCEEPGSLVSLLLFIVYTVG